MRRHPSFLHLLIWKLDFGELLRKESRVLETLHLSLVSVLKLYTLVRSEEEVTLVFSLHFTGLSSFIRHLISVCGDQFDQGGRVSLGGYKLFVVGIHLGEVMFFLS